MKQPRNILTFNSLGRYGRFANGLFQIAGTIGIARKNGLDFAFPAWHNHDHKDRFGSQEDIDLQKYFVNPLPLYTGPALPDNPVPWGYHDVRLNRSVSLSGHMQSEKYFAHCIDEVRHYLTMKDEPKQMDAIALHWRLGDYDDQFHPRLTKQYYAPALEHFGKDVPVMVFSDDIKCVKQQLTGDRFTFVDADYLESFKLMKSCRHLIIGNSSYSLMAAILATGKDKKVIAPSPWFGPAWGYSYRDMGRDIYSPGWTVINYEHQKQFA